MAYRFDGKPVSKPWYLVLTHARRMGVNFTLTDGRRTLAMQRARVRKYGLWSPSNPTGAARPSLGAPHINWGRANHAIDVNALDGGTARLVAFLRRKGCKSAGRPIRSEPWHIQISRRDLLRLARRIEKARRKR